MYHQIWALKFKVTISVAQLNSTQLELKLAKLHCNQQIKEYSTSTQLK